MYKEAKINFFENGKHFVSAYEKYNDKDFTFKEDGQIDFEKSYDNLIKNINKYLDMDSILMIGDLKDDGDDKAPERTDA